VDTKVNKVTLKSEDGQTFMLGQGR
jgi:hypothetical protein